MVFVRAMRVVTIGAALAALALVAAGTASAMPRLEPPQAEITSSPPDEIFIKRYGTATATWEFGADQPGATLTCKFKGVKFHPCHSPITFSGLTRGRYTFTVYAFNLKKSPDTTRARDQIRVVKRK
ncbi:MAG: hypothetical protein U0R51_01720 [Solirubrobacterales bacterium]